MANQLDEAGSSDREVLRRQMQDSDKSLSNLFSLLSRFDSAACSGMKSAAAVLAIYGSIEAIPAEHQRWQSGIRGAAALASSLAEHREQARLYRQLATLRRDVPQSETLQQIAWHGADRRLLTQLAEDIEDPKILARVERWRD